MIDYYKILNVSQNASLDEIKKAYRKLAKKYHPDNYDGSEKEASEHMSRINEAYDVLMDESKRFLYEENCRQEKSCNKSTSNRNTTTDNSAPRKETSSPKEEPISHEKSSSSTEDTTFHEEPITSSTHKTEKPKGCVSGCFSKIIKCCLFLVIAFFLVRHFNLFDIDKPLIDEVDSILNANKEDSNESPDGCINSYFNSLRESNINAANEIISDSSYDESAKTIVEIYQSIRKDDKYYLLFKEILNFNIHIDDINYNANKTKAVISVTIQNIDCYGFMAYLISSCNSEDTFESLSQEELNALIYDMMENKKSYMTASVCIFEVEKSDELWKISNIDDVNAMISILIGKIDLLAKSIDDAE